MQSFAFARRAAILVTIVALGSSALLPGLHMHVDAERGATHASVVHRHAPAHGPRHLADAEHQTDGSAALAPDHRSSDQKVVWLDADRADQRAGAPILLFTLAALAGPEVCDPPARASFAPSPASRALHDPPRRPAGLRGPPQLS